MFLDKFAGTEGKHFVHDGLLTFLAMIEHASK